MPLMLTRQLPERLRRVEELDSPQACRAWLQRELGRFWPGRSRELGARLTPGCPLQETAALVRDLLRDSDVTVYLVPAEEAPERMRDPSWAAARRDEVAETLQRVRQRGFAAGNMAGMRVESARMDAEPPMASMAPMETPDRDAAPQPKPKLAARPSLLRRPQEKANLPRGLIRRLERMDQGFSQTLMRLIDERGMTDPECYRRANVDRKLFSKIRRNLAYQPARTTAAAFAVALRLSPQETRQLMQTAGYAMSMASRFDVTVMYFIEQGIWDVDLINQVLYEMDLPLLGGS